MNTNIPIKIILFLSVFLVLSSFVAAGNCAYYFYGAGCADCEISNNKILEVEKDYPDWTIEKYEIYFHPENADMLKEYLTAYEVPEKSQGLPALILSNSYLIGDSPINDLAEDSIINSAKGCPTLTPGKVVGITGKSLPFNIVKTLSFFKVTSGALADALRPGMLALVLILIFCLMNIRDDKKILEVGTRYILGVYMMYFLFSVGLFTWFASSPLSIFFYRFVGLIAVIYGIVIIKNFLVQWRLIKLSEKMQTVFAVLGGMLLSIYGVLFVSIFSALFSFASVSNVLLSLRYAFRSSSGWLALPITLYYLFIMILPLIAVLVLFMLLRQKHQLKAVEKIQKINAWKKHYFNVSKVLVSLGCVVLGVILLFL
ncbi:hypothetical protein HYT52_04555 [Candidatus Woesearchaeota archaeon]|nr:hypothetical protein [Candidatus Woesearchaeota archaeon]